MPMSQPLAVKKSVAASMLGISTRTVDRRIADKTLETSSLGGLRLVLVASINKALGIRAAERPEAA
jgi:hypothetical protein